MTSCDLVFSTQIEGTPLEAARALGTGEESSAGMNCNMDQTDASTGGNGNCGGAAAASSAERTDDAVRTSACTTTA